MLNREKDTREKNGLAIGAARCPRHTGRLIIDYCLRKRDAIVVAAATAAAASFREFRRGAPGRLDAPMFQRRPVGEREHARWQHRTVSGHRSLPLRSSASPPRTLCPFLLRVTTNFIARKRKRERSLPDREKVRRDARCAIPDSRIPNSTICARKILEPTRTLAAR